MIASKKKSLQSYKNFLSPLLVIIGIVSIFFWQVIIKSYVPLPGDFVVGVYYPWLDYKWGYAAGVPVKNPITTDVVSFTYPMQTLAIDIMKNGQLPLWNPLILGGAPLLANFQSAPFSPTNFVYFMFDKVSAWSIQIILQHILAAGFTYLLLKRWKVSNAGAILGGMIYSFSGFNLIWSQWNGHTLAASFIPLLLLFTDLYFSTGKIIFAVSFAFALGFQILSGYPQVVLYTAIALVFYWLFHFSKSKLFWKKTLVLGLFAILGFGLSAFQILPGAELLSFSQREVEPHPYDWAFLPWVKTITFIAPDYFGNHATQNYWGPQDYTSNTGFVGVVGITLAFLAIISKHHRKITFLILLSAVSLLLSFPTFLSIWIWKSGIFGLQAASAHRALILWNLSVALLAGFGIDTLFTSTFKKRLFALIVPGALLMMSAVVTVYFYKSRILMPDLFFAFGIPKYYVGLRNLIFPSLILGVLSLLVIFATRFKKYTNYFTLLIIFVAVFEMYRFGWKFTPFVSRSFVYPDTPVLTFLKEQDKPFRATGSRVIPINLRMPYGLESLEGYDAVYPLISSQFVAAVNGGKSDSDPQGRYAIVDNDTSPLMDMVNTKFYLALKYDAKGNPRPNGDVSERFLTDRFKKAFEDKTTVVFESTTALPRAFMAYDWEIAKEEPLEALLRQDVASKKLVLESEPVIEKPKNIGVSTIEYLEYSTQGSKLKVDTSEDGILFISDTFYPGWRVFIDGKESLFLKANYAFRGLPITKGNHIVEYYYAPKSFVDGLKLAFFSLSAIEISLIFRRKLNIQA